MNFGAYSLSILNCGLNYFCIFDQYNITDLSELAISVFVVVAVVVVVVVDILTFDTECYSQA
jgi:hypothetical protein